MSNYYAPQQPQPGGPYAPQAAAQNLQFYPSSYGPADASPAPPPPGGHQGGYGFGGGSAQQGFQNAGFGAPGGGVSGRMGEQGGLRTGWLAAFSTEGYDGEPPLLEELGVNFGHIQAKVGSRSVPHEEGQIADTTDRPSPS